MLTKKESCQICGIARVSKKVTVQYIFLAIGSTTDLKLQLNSKDIRNKKQFILRVFACKPRN